MYKHRLYPGYRFMFGVGVERSYYAFACQVRPESTVVVVVVVVASCSLFIDFFRTFMISSSSILIGNRLSFFDANSIPSLFESFFDERHCCGENFDFVINFIKHSFQCTQRLNNNNLLVTHNEEITIRSYLQIIYSMFSISYRELVVKIMIY